MNIFSTRYLIPAAAMLVLASCNDIPEEKRFIPVDPVQPSRAVLIEDFTGQNCVNCPEAHAVIEQLEEQYPGSIVAVSIHAGAFALSKEMTSFEAGFIGLMTDEGQHYNDKWGISSWPAGVIDRHKDPEYGKFVIEFDKWATVVRNELAKEPDVAIDLAAAIDGNDVKIDVTLEPQVDIDGYLQVWVVESGIVARQKSQSQGTIKDYVHNNVFRAAVNGIDGEPVKLSDGIHTSKSYSVALRHNEQERWNPANLSIVAFVADDKGVHQAAKVHVAAQDAEE